MRILGETELLPLSKDPDFAFGFTTFYSIRFYPRARITMWKYLLYGFGLKARDILIVNIQRL